MSVVQANTQSNLPSNVRAMFETDVQKAASERTGSPSLTFKQGQMHIGDTNFGNGPLGVYILAHIRVNTFYLKAYDPNNVDAPTCYSMFTSENENNAQPHPESDAKQSDFCSNCPHNVWGSAGNGKRGKACSNVRRLAIIPAGFWDNNGQYCLFLPEQLAAQEIMHCRLPVTSCNTFAKYIKANATRDGRPPWAYVTNISTRLHPTNQFEVCFDMIAKPEDEVILNVLNQLKQGAEKGINFPYMKAEAAPAPVQQRPVAGQVRM